MRPRQKLIKSKNIGMSIEEAFENFIDEKQSLNRSKATIRSMEGTFKLWHSFLRANDFALYIDKVEVSYVRKYTSYCLREDMKPTTLNHYLRDIRSFLYWAMENNLISNSFKVKLVTEQEVIKETYSEEELELLLSKPSNSAAFVEWRSWAVINWILATGNRAATVCNIQMSDLDYKKNEIYIRKTKTNKAMILPFSKALKQVISEYSRMWRTNAPDTAYLFPSVCDEIMSSNALKQSIRKYNFDRGISKSSIHAFRHTFAKQWIRNSGDVFSLQKIMGHSTLEMTRRYVNMFSEDLKKDFENYNPLDRLKHSSNRTSKIKRN